jgi:peptidoglycan L-alanyl-D-glutamate endopeptidase CwlK
MDVDLERPDRDLRHLHPEFAARVERIIAEANRETAGKHAAFAHWLVFEGYRSVERQLYLYAQGRTRPGSIVTNAQSPHFHGVGLAVDVVWMDTAGEPHWDGPEAMWAIVRHCAHLEGLITGMDWAGAAGRRLADWGHIQPSDEQAAAWRASACAHLKAQGLGVPA